MTTIEFRREVPVAHEVDVLVVGGGPAGIGAAIAAARGGARTLLIERFGYLGGNLTAGLVGPCMTAYSLDGSEQLIGGIFDEFVRRMEAIGGALHPSGIEGGSAWSGFISYGHERVTPFDPEAAKLIAARMCREAGVEILFHAFVADSLTTTEPDGRTRLDGVVAATKSGLVAIRAKQTVDCSADGDVAARSGVGFDLGREGDGLMQPMTMFFRVSHVDDAAVEEYIRAHPDDYRPFAGLVGKAQQEGRFPSPRRGVGMYRTLEPGVWRINTTRILRKDGTNAADLTAAELEGREQVAKLVEFFRSDLPGFRNCRLMDTAAQIGVRETRRIHGEYTLTLGDLKNGRRFEDVIALCGYPVDIHDPTGSGGGVTPELQVANAYEIPFRVMVPRGMDGLLVAGRSVSATHEAMAAIRVMPPCFAMGQAAGSAAAMAVNGGYEPRDTPIPALHERLRADGAILETKG
jgi:hypothetical protein